MQARRALGTTTSLALALVAQGAAADVSPAEVWADFKGYMEGYGYSVSGTEALSGSVLTVSDVQMSFVDAAAASAKMTIDQLTFTDQGDGTVSVGFPARMPFTFQADDLPEPGEMVITQDGLTMIVSEQDGALTYTYSAASMGMTMSQTLPTADQAGTEAFDFGFAMNGLNGTSTSVVTDLRKIAQTLTTEEMTYSFNFGTPEREAGNITGSLSDVAFDGTSTLPLTMVTSDPKAMLEGAFALDGTFRTNGGQMNLTAIDRGQETQFGTTSQSSVLAVKMGSGGIVYDTDATNVTVSLAGGQMPFPLNLSAAQLGTKIGVPILAKEAPQDFSFGMTLADLVIPDMLWGMADPGGVLPREPVTIKLDTEGQARILADLFDESQMEAVSRGTAQIGELESLTLKDLTLSAAGALVTGTGQATFDNSDKQTFGGIPRPEGSVSISMDGVNGLIDKLIQMGLVAEQDAMGARMMMSMFAVPGDGPDKLSSTLEINAEGHVIANGMRIQ